MTLILRSEAFESGADIPARYTCQGEDLSPPLEWSGVPPETRSLVLIVDDPDAPDPRAPTRTWVHWVLYNLPAGVCSLSEGVKVLPPGTGEGLNDWQKTGYGGPCPPIGRHRYIHRLYALDRVLDDLHHPTRPRLEAAMVGHILEQAELVGNYRKH
ncbi:phospholipid-binding protein, PBP family [Desulfuromonas soudanensis]|uniref:Phospholipid-binding protein, PBP family n=1 Tax=Desulfuromonas soudanensis TaxID=1603606 RepID=A0A0M4D424_9BACT|nr:YbhB/YbcL family Raf kinase inhibitor-like protein [Desulfuromonas soudanensis]ALC17351.1 phospholipid-binding protein, PBP family [Desulfuromonas soudanensis]